MCDNTLILQRVLEELRELRALNEARLLTRREAANYLGVSTTTFRYKHEPHIDCYKLAGSIRFRKLALVDYINKNQNNGNNRE